MLPMIKKEIIISTANELFLKYGFKKITVDEICKTASVSRKTYYSYFKNKDELIKQIIDNIADYGFKLYDDIFNNNALSFAEKMEKGMLAKIEMSKKWSMEFFTDLMLLEDGELLQYYTQKISRRSFELTNEFLKKAQDEGDIDGNLNLQYVMWILQKQFEHINEPELLTIFSSVEDLTRQMSQVFVHGISKSK